MKTFKIAVIPGDGVGVDVIPEGIKALNAAARLDGGFSFEFTHFPWGCRYYLERGEMMPQDGIERLKQFDAILLGAVGYPGVPDHVSLWGLLLKIRKEFDQYVNLRPVKLIGGAPCPLKGKKPSDIDMVFVRENTEGEYTGSGSFSGQGTPDEAAVQNAVFTRRGCERVMRYAFELARRQGRALTSVSKANALNYSMVFWDKIFGEIKAEYPTVPTSSLLVDAAAMLMVHEPERFGVVVTSNLFGDILTDLGAAIAGGIGLAAGANLNPEKKHPSMFEPIHGSAPDIAGTGIANPMATIWSCAQMLDFLVDTSWSGRFISALEAVLGSPRYNYTPDLGGTGTTSRVGDSFVSALEGVCR